MPLFLTFSRKKSQPDAVPAHFFSIFFETVGYLEGHQCAPPLPCAAGAGHDIADFGVIWGRVFSVKNRLFSISISIKRGLAEVWTHWRSNPPPQRTFFFPQGAVMGLPKNNLAEFGGRKGPQTPQNTKNSIPQTAILGIASRKRVIFDRVTLCFATVSDFFSQKIATRCSSGTFFFDFFDTVGNLEGRQCAPPLPCTARGPGTT